MMNLKLKNVKKKIGNNEVLREVNLEFSGGNIYVLSGENGSGKTMLIRYLGGMIFADDGELLFDGVLHKKSDRLPYSVGIIIENCGLYDNLTLYDNLELLARINKKAGKQDILDAIDKVGLTYAAHKKYGKFSLGMKKRAMIAQAIMEKPDVLLLDEPCNGLDEDGRARLYRILDSEKERGAVIIISSHLSEDMEFLADYLISVREGTFKEIEHANR